MGVTDCDNMLMLLGVSTKMTEKERDVVVPLIMRGFKDSAMEAGTTVTGGQTVVNPWCTIGGVATTVCQPNEYIVYVSTICIGFLTFIYNFCKKNCSFLNFKCYCIERLHTTIVKSNLPKTSISLVLLCLVPIMLLWVMCWC